MLFSEGCPHIAATIARLREVLSAENVAALIEQVDVGNSHTSFPPAFRGSPTVLINGRDISGDDAPCAQAAACRLYPGESNSGVPPADLIRNALRHARTRETT